MSEVKVNKITPTTNCGTVTLGDSGDTIAIASGVTLSNSGSITNSGTITNTGTISGGTITGTIDNQVNWDTTAKTAGFTAVAGNGYFVNTTSGAITVTLPATPTAGDLVGIKDYANTANTNNITIDRNGSNIQGTANNFTISVAGTSITLIYVDGTQGWVSTGAAKASDISEQQLFVTATGGTITTCGNYKIHTFTGPGTFCVSCAGTAPGSNTVDYLVVAGGGGGTADLGGGGGAGGYRESKATGAPWTASPLATCASLPVTASPYPITVGGGGSVPLGNGSNSIFSTITSTGGGGGAGINNPGNTGGSGGGNGSGRSGAISGAAGNTPPVSPPQGQPGGPSVPTSPSTPSDAGSGGGGAGVSGSTSNNNGAGGNGVTSSINASPVTRAGGGGGGAFVSQPLNVGGSGGGGRGGQGPGANPLASRSGVAGTTNTGGGGGGGGQAGGAGAAGGSGIVIIRYKFQ
jgi:hypothetical protein